MKYILLVLSFCIAFDTMAQTHSAGSIDSTFGTFGITTVENIGANDLAVLSDNTILITGDGIQRGATVTKFTADGIVDSTFGSNGIANVITGQIHPGGMAIAIQPDGKIMVGGSGIDTARVHYTKEDFLTFRLLPDGTPDTTYNKKGFTITDLYGSNDEIVSIALQSDGKIIACGNSGSSSVALVRYSPNGILDTTFGKHTKGKVITNIPNASACFAFCVLIQPDDKIIVCGSADYSGPSTFLLIRYNSNGSPDSTFGDNGIVITNISNDIDEAEAMQLLPDGKILVAGSSHLRGTGNDFVLARYKPNGVLDSTFAKNGLAINDIVDSIQDVPTCMTIQTDGKILLAGRSFDFTTRLQSMARYTPGGYLDSTFGVNGKATYSIASDDVKAMGLQNTGKIILAGTTQAGTAPVFVERFYPTSTVGLPSISSLQNKMRLFPNPSGGVFTVQSPLQQSGGLITIIDVMGKLVAQVPVAGTSTRIDLSSQPNGLYFVQIYLGSETVTLKVVVSK